MTLIQPHAKRKALLYRELTDQICAAAVEVHKELRAGFLEKVYEESLAVELRNRGIAFERQKPLSVTYKGVLVGHYVADIVVDGKVICEIKAIERISPECHAQVLNYLRATGLRVGLILNFGAPLIQIRRNVH